MCFFTSISDCKPANSSSKHQSTAEQDSWLHTKIISSTLDKQCGESKLFLGGNTALVWRQEIRRLLQWRNHKWESSEKTKDPLKYLCHSHCWCIQFTQTVQTLLSDSSWAQRLKFVNKKYHTNKCDLVCHSQYWHSQRPLRLHSIFSNIPISCLVISTWIHKRWRSSPSCLY